VAWQQGAQVVRFATSTTVPLAQLQAGGFNRTPPPGFNRTPPRRPDDSDRRSDI
jgi:hypothetical protein